MQRMPRVLALKHSPISFQSFSRNLICRQTILVYWAKISCYMSRCLLTKQVHCQNFSARSVESIIERIKNSESELCKKLIEVIKFSVVDIETNILDESTMQTDDLMFFSDKTNWKIFRSIHWYLYIWKWWSRTTSNIDQYQWRSQFINGWIHQKTSTLTMQLHTFYNETMQIKRRKTVYVTIDELLNETLHRTF